MLRKRKITLLMALLLCFSAVNLSAKELSKQELHAFMGIITQFIMSDEPDKKPPVFTTSSSVTVAENQNYAYRVKVRDASPVRFSLIGGDSNAFNINASTGAITFRTTPDFETRNTYSFRVKATDSSNNSSTQSVTIHIRDLPEVGKPKKTRQLISYRNGDDGYYQKGIMPSYTRNDGIGVVTDHVTGFQWQDNIGPRYAQYYNDADTYCKNLSLDGGGWRVPTIRELLTIIERGRTNPVLDSTVFKNFSYDSSSSSSHRDNYWTSTLSGEYNYRWKVGPKIGWVSSSNQYGRVRCVR